MFEELVACGKQIEQQKDVRCVVMSGEGDCFSSGIDLSSFEDPKSLPRAFAHDNNNVANLAQQCGLVWFVLVHLSMWNNLFNWFLVGDCWKFLWLLLSTAFVTVPAFKSQWVHAFESRILTQSSQYWKSATAWFPIWAYRQLRDTFCVKTTSSYFAILANRLMWKRRSSTASWHWSTTTRFSVHISWRCNSNKNRPLRFEQANGWFKKVFSVKTFTVCESKKSNSCHWFVHRSFKNECETQLLKEDRRNEQRKETKLSIQPQFQ